MPGFNNETNLPEESQSIDENNNNNDKKEEDLEIPSFLRNQSN